MDETYREAGKLDSSAFSPNFNPYSLGIIDTTAQALIPKLAQRTNESSGLRAKLYQLNVCFTMFSSSLTVGEANIVARYILKIQSTC